MGQRQRSVAALAGPTTPAPSYADVTTVLETAAAARRWEPTWTCCPAKHRVSAYAIADVGLLHNGAAMTFQSIALPQGRGPTRCSQHGELMALDVEYARR